MKPRIIHKNTLEGNFMAVLSKLFYKGLILSSKNIKSEFIYDTENAFDINASLLKDIINKNKDTEYGKSHNFKSMKSIDDYKRYVKLCEYSDLEDYILRECNGEKNILTKEDVEYFGHSSGTTGKQKLIPITKSSRILTLKLNGILCQRMVYEIFKKDWTYGKGVMLVDMIEGHKSSGGINVSSASSGGMSKIKPLVPYVWTSPIEVMEIEDKDTAFYLHVLFALKDENVMYIGGLFISAILDFFRFIENNSARLLNDLRTGTVSDILNIDNEVRKSLNTKLTKCTKRADYLENEFNKGFNDIAKRIWPHLLYIASVTGANFANYNDMVRKYIGNVPICSIAYAASEGFIGINPYKDKVCYVIHPGTCFYEFIKEKDIDKKNPQTLLLNEVKKGEAYEVVLTNGNGLYRYRLGDVIKVIDFYNNSPMIVFLYRKNQLLNMVSEKTTETHIKNALKSVSDKYDLDIIDYTTYADNSVTPGRYIIFLEIANYHMKDGIYALERILDKELSKTNLAYGRFRNGNRLQMLKIKLLRRGTFERYKKSLSKKNISANQIKIPRVIKDKNIFN